MVFIIILGLQYLGLLFLKYLDEFTSFKCLVNIVHQSYFINFYMGNMREVFFIY